MHFKQGLWIYSPSWRDIPLYFDIRKLVMAMEWDNQLSQSGAYPSETKMAMQPTIENRINLAIKQAEEKLASAKRAKEIFDTHPELEELLNIMQKGAF